MLISTFADSLFIILTLPDLLKKNQSYLHEWNIFFLHYIILIGFGRSKSKLLKYAAWLSLLSASVIHSLR